MVSKKKLQDELKKFNKDLEKFLPELDFSIVNDGVISVSNSDEDELITLMASNLSDIKTELALIRKNLVSQTEGILRQIVLEQQNQLSSQLSKMFSSFIMEMKSSFSNIVNDLTMEIQKLNSELNLIKTENKDFAEKLKEFNINVSNLTGTASNFGNIINEEKLLQKKVLSYMSHLDKKISNVERKITSQLETHFTKELKTINNLNSEFNQFKSEIKAEDQKVEEEYKTILESEYSIKKEVLDTKSSLKLEVEEILNKINSERKTTKVSEVKGNKNKEKEEFNSENKNVDDSILDYLELETKSLDNSLNNIKEEVIIDVSENNKLLSIEEKLKKLESLKEL
jgi:hypothetical protein